MKTIYQCPAIQVLSLDETCQILAGSPDHQRSPGDPTDIPDGPDAAKFHLVGSDVFDHGNNVDWQNGTEDSDNSSESLW